MRMRCKIYQHDVDLGRGIDVEGSLEDAKKASAKFIDELGLVQDGAAAWGGGVEFVDYEICIMNEHGHLLAKRKVTEQTWRDET